MTRIAVFPADDAGCGHYRLIWPAQALAAAGCDVTLMPPGYPWYGYVGYDPEVGPRPDDRLVELQQLPDADVVVLQRVTTRHIADAVNVMRRAGIRVVVDMDDDLSRVDPRNVNYRKLQPHLRPEDNYRHAARACADADLVTASTPAVARRYGRHGRVTVIPNFVPRQLCDQVLYTGAPRVVWTGTTKVHPGDLDVTRGAVARALDRTGAEFVVVGSSEGVAAALDLPADPEASGMVPIHEYGALYAQATVAICPLRDSQFNQAKSWIKALEALAVGLVVCASPSEAYAALAKQVPAGIRLCAKPRHWFASLVEALSAPEATAERAEAARALVAERFTVEANVDRWATAWVIDALSY